MKLVLIATLGIGRIINIYLLYIFCIAVMSEHLVLNNTLLFEQSLVEFLFEDPLEFDHRPYSPFPLIPCLLFLVQLFAKVIKVYIYLIIIILLVLFPTSLVLTLNLTAKSFQY